MACATPPPALQDAPILPIITPKIRALYAEGVAAGNRADVFSKLGDCMTDNEHFLKPLAKGEINWGEYSTLRPVFERFNRAPARNTPGWREASFATPSLAAAGGYNIAGPLDPTWADPKLCGNDSPLACEYRLAKPGIAMIMFGTNDVASTDDKTFETYLRQVTQQTLAAKIVPVLHTFPTRPENPKRAAELNAIVARVARDLDVPLLNFNRALAALPNQGVDPTNSTHLSLPPSGRADDFSPAGLQFGANLHNLVTLQVLEAITRLP